jgi:hypothetical protein
MVLRDDRLIVGIHRRRWKTPTACRRIGAPCSNFMLKFYIFGAADL